MSIKTANRIIAKVVNTEVNNKFSYVKLTINLNEEKKHYDYAVLLKDAPATAVKVFAAAKPGDYVQLDNCFFDPFIWKNSARLTIRVADAKLVK